MRRLLILILPILFTIAGICATASAASSGVEDDGKFFSADAIAKAQSIIREIKSEDHRDVLVVTYDSVPADRQDQFKSQTKVQFYNDWANDVGKTNRVNGIVILMTKSPGHLEIAVGDKTQRQSFPLKSRDDVRDQMLPLLRQKQYDYALTQGLTVIQQNMTPAPPSATTEPSDTQPDASPAPKCPRPKPPRPNPK